MICAHFGMESIGVSSPLIIMKIMMKKNNTNISCCNVSEKFAIVRWSPECENKQKCTKVDSPDRTGR